MAETIKGINIVIGSDTTALTASLADVNKRSRDIQSELKQVEKLLRLDPTNTELLAQKQQLLGNSISNTREKLDRLRAAQQQVSEQFSRGDITEGQYRAFQREVIATERELQRLESGLNDVSGEMESQTSTASRLGREYRQAFSEAQQQLGNTFERSKKLGTAVTAAGGIIAAGLADSTKAAADFEQSMANVYSVMAPDEINQFGGALKDLAITMGADTKYSATEAAAGIEELVKAGVSVQDIMNGGLQGALSLATAGELELADAAEIASTALNAFKDDNITVQRAADLLAGAANASATSVSEMKFGLSQVSAVASQVGLSFEDTTSALAVFAQNGLKGSDAGTSLKTMLMNLQPSTDKAYNQFEDLGLLTLDTAKAMEFLSSKGIKPADMSIEGVTKSLAAYLAKMDGAKSVTGKYYDKAKDMAAANGWVYSSFYDATGSLKSMDEIANLLQGSMSGLNDMQRQAALETMFGSDAIRAGSILYKEGAKGVDAMAEAMNKIKADDVAAQKMDTLKGTIEQLKGAFETAKISIGEAFLPVVRRVGEVLTGLVDGFNNLSPGMKETIAVTAAVAAGIGLIAGPALLLIGFLPQIAAGFSLVGGALAVLTGPVGLAVAAIAGLVAGGVALYNHFSQDSIPAVQRFGDEVSESTQKAVGGFLDLNDKATVALNELRWSGEEVTKETAASITETFNQMGDQVSAAMKEDHAAQLQTMKDFFAGSKALTQEEETAALQKMQESQTRQQGLVQEAQRKITGILDGAAKQKRGITEWERQEINRLQEQMVETGIKHMSKNELEQKSIMERMRANASTLSARQAAEVVKNSVKQRDEAIAAADKQYNDVVKAIIQQRDESKSITADQAAKLIAEAKKQRDGVVEKAKSMHTDVVNEAKKQAGEHVDQVNWQTGEILTKWDIFKRDVKKKWDQIKKWAADTWNEMWKAITGKTDEIKKDVQAKWDGIVNFFKNIDLKQIGADIMNGLKNGIKSKIEELGKVAKDVSSKIGQSIRDFFGIHSPSRLTTGYGENISQGLAVGMDKGSKDAEKAAKRTAKKLDDAFKESFAAAKHEYKMGTIDEGEYIAKLQKVNKAYANSAAEHRKITEEIDRVNKASAAEQVKAAKEAFENSKTYIESRKQANELTSQEELALWEKLQERYKVGTKERIAVDKEVNKIRTELDKQTFENSKSFIESRAAASEISLTQELALWEKVQARYKAGTDERKAAEEAAGKVRLEIYNRLTEASETFLTKTKEINANVEAEEKRLNEAYAQAVEQRAKSINDFAGLFDQVSVKSETTGKELLENLRGQVEYLGTWATEIEKLAARGIDQGLLAQLREMGPKAAPELAALNSLTDAELAEYVKLWQQKAAESRKQAVSELSGLRADTDTQIKGLYTDAAAQLENLRKEFDKQVKEIRGGTTKEFSAMKASLPNIGKQAIEGLINGMSSMEGALAAKAKSMADSVAKTMRKALDVHSPSRVTRQIGIFTGEGLALGIRDSIGSVSAQADAMARATQSALEGMSPTFGAAGVAGAGTAGAVLNMEGMMSGANFYVRTDEDIKSIARELWGMANMAARGVGGAR